MNDPRSLVELDGTEPIAHAGVTAESSPDPEAQVEITLMLRPDPKGEGASLMARIDDEVAQGRPLAPEWDAHCAACSTEMGRLVAFAEREGLEVRDQDRGAATMTWVGTAGQIEQVFGVKLVLHEHGSGKFLSHRGKICVPHEFKDIIEHVFGLDEGPYFYRSAMAVPAQASKGSTTSPTPSDDPCDFKARYSPKELAALYRYPPEADGKGQTVGILTLGGGFFTSDMQAYFPQVGMEVPEIRVVGKNDPAPKEVVAQYVKSLMGCAESPEMDSDLSNQVVWTVETTGNVQVAGAFANGADLVLYIIEGFSARLIIQTLLNILKEGTTAPDILSASWGETEKVLPTAVTTAINKVMMRLALRGTTLCFATGDFGSSGAPQSVVDGALTVQFPASSPFALACGGTKVESKGGTITSETVWNESLGATGGGASSKFALPLWQKGAGVEEKTGLSMRGTPDVAAAADTTTGVELLVAGVQFGTNGTSTATPLWATLIARLNQACGIQLGYVTPLLYLPAISACQRDVTVGDNSYPESGGKYDAGKGWDPCTGWGAPDGLALLSRLKKHCGDF